MVSREQARTNVVMEILQAERDYVKHLKDVVEVRYLISNIGVALKYTDAIYYNYVYKNTMDFSVRYFYLPFNRRSLLYFVFLFFISSLSTTF